MAFLLVQEEQGRRPILPSAAMAAAGVIPATAFESRGNGACGERVGRVEARLGLTSDRRLNRE